ncbi:MAG: hypothetical protein IKU39_04075 [Lachnospiraceae bacterium]|nr:hypothetical protein [Lachnospiraceae bacterium]
MKSESVKKEKRSVFHKNFVLVLVMGVVLFSLSVYCWLKPEDKFSESERRVLKSLPTISVEAIVNGKFMKEFEDYAVDQFPFREEFRTLKAYASYGLLGKKDNNGVYAAEGHLSKIEYPMQMPMLDHAVTRMEEIYNLYLKDKNSKCYFSIVPDKNFYLAEENGYLAMDYEKLFSYMQEKVDFAKYIDITGLLELQDYYKTDTHWRQEKIIDVAQFLQKEMSGESLDTKYEVKEAPIPFYGVYCGQSALSVEPDKLYYLESDALKGSIVTSYDTGKPLPATIYNMEKAQGNDPYEMFLSGTSALQVIVNPLVSHGKELIVFRDSFGSSLIPLLVEGYSKITVIDTRYVQSKMLGNLVDFHGQDTLFIYSTIIFNNSMALR